MNSDHMIFILVDNHLYFQTNVSIHSNKGIRLYVNDKPSEDDVEWKNIGGLLVE